MPSRKQVNDQKQALKNIVDQLVAEFEAGYNQPMGPEGLAEELTRRMQVAHPNMVVINERPNWKAMEEDGQTSYLYRPSDLSINIWGGD